MEFFKQNSKIDFMGARKWTALLSSVLFIFSFAILMTKGLYWGLDFTGGTQIEVSYEQSANLPDIRERLRGADFEAQVVSFGTSREVLISIAPKADQDQASLVRNVMKVLPGATERRVDFVGPQVGKELMTKGMMAIIVSMFATMIYIALRFEYRFAVGAIMALIHDPLIILGAFSLMHIEFDLKALAALLAVIGYSLNDTIVVFDRVRENFQRVRKSSVIEIMNLSINQTLSRTIITSALTLIVVASLLIYGGETIRGFSLALLIGIIVGTYSSIYVAGAFAVFIGLDRKDLISNNKKKVDDLP